MALPLTLSMFQQEICKTFHAPFSLYRCQDLVRFSLNTYYIFVLLIKSPLCMKHIIAT